MNRAKLLIVGAALLGCGVTQAASEPVTTSKHIAKIMAATDGATEQTAYKVTAVHDEYEILAALHLTPKTQSLVIKKKPFDVMDATDDTGIARRVWFDISSFYPEF